MRYNNDYFFPEETLDQLSKHSGKPVMYIRADGPSSITDQQKLNDVWDFYIGKCPNKILAGLQQRGQLYCYFSTETEAWNAFNEWFPQKKQLLEEEMHYYIYAELVNIATGVDVING